MKGNNIDDISVQALLDTLARVSMETCQSVLGAFTYRCCLNS